MTNLIRSRGYLSIVTNIFGEAKKAMCAIALFACAAGLFQWHTTSRLWQVGQ